jgi:hypothetical protein
MISIPAFARKLLWVAMLPGVVAATHAQDQSAGDHESRFSKEQLSQMFDAAKENAPVPEKSKTESAVTNVDEGEVIVLEPVEVKSDDVELHRKVDKSMKPKASNPVTAERLGIFTEQNRKLLQDAQYDARASGRFFSDEEQRIGPADVPGTGKITLQDVSKAAKSTVENVKAVLADE